MEVITLGLCEKHRWSESYITGHADLLQNPVAVAYFSY